MTKQVKKIAICNKCKAEIAVQSRKSVLNASPQSTTALVPAGSKNPPAFKPGNTPHLQYGNQVLNDNVCWDEVIHELCLHGLSMAEIATRLDVDVDVVQTAAKRNYAQLNFKTGARLLALHMQQTMQIN